MVAKKQYFRFGIIVSLPGVTPSKPMYVRAAKRDVPIK